MLLEQFSEPSKREKNKVYEGQSVPKYSEIANGNHFIPVSQWNQHYDWPPIGGLRHLIFYADTNGFNSCIRRVGRRVLINEAKFFEWVEQGPSNSNYYSKGR